MTVFLTTSARRGPGHVRKTVALSISLVAEQDTLPVKQRRDAQPQTDGPEIGWMAVLGACRPRRLGSDTHPPSSAGCSPLPPTVSPSGSSLVPRRARRFVDSSSCAISVSTVPCFCARHERGRRHAVYTTQPAATPSASPAGGTSSPPRTCHATWPTTRAPAAAPQTSPAHGTPADCQCT